MNPFLESSVIGSIYNADIYTETQVPLDVAYAAAREYIKETDLPHQILDLLQTKARYIAMLRESNDTQRKT